MAQYGWDDFWSVGDDSFWAGLEYTIFSAVLMGAAGIIALVLSLKLINKYKSNKKRSVLFLGLAMLVFDVAMIALLPSMLDISYLAKMIDDLVARMIGLVAVMLYLKFAIEIFVPRREANNQQVMAFQVVFLAVNAAFIVAHYWIELSIWWETGTEFNQATFIVMQESIASTPFLYIFVVAWRLAERVDVPGEKKALMYISFSGLLLFVSYAMIALDDSIGLDNPSSLPMCICLLLGFFCFYIGVARPGRFFGPGVA
ncbi:MAG: hypothetical protein JW839_17060 [Candidatus Lokiarchaeota archaeon]|nr:hypothetical protein [Candidatus Lokiarchaeota archaeon]